MIRLKNIAKAFDNALEIKILGDINFDVDDGEFVTIFGPNGCGKSTLLNIIARLDKPSSGNIFFEDSEEICAFIFQDYKANLLPWKNVFDNICQPLAWNNIAGSDLKKRVDDLLIESDVSIPLNSYPGSLSGGQAQLISILRSVIIKPTLLLADEPFSALDLINRWKLSLFLRKLWITYKFKCIFVSHDIDEAIFLGSKLIILSSNPTVVSKVFDINLPIDRTKDTLVSPEFFKIKKEILQSINI